MLPSENYGASAADGAKVDLPLSDALSSQSTFSSASSSTSASAAADDSDEESYVLLRIPSLVRLDAPDSAAAEVPSVSILSYDEKNIVITVDGNIYSGGPRSFASKAPTYLAFECATASDNAPHNVHGGLDPAPSVMLSYALSTTEAFVLKEVTAVPVGVQSEN